MQQFVDWRKLAINDSSGCAKYTQELNSNCQKGKKLKNRIKTSEKYTSVATIYYPIEEDHPRKIFISLSNRKIISPLGFCFFKLTTFFDTFSHTSHRTKLSTHDQKIATWRENRLHLISRSATLCSSKLSGFLNGFGASLSLGVAERGDWQCQLTRIFLYLVSFRY